MIDKYVPQIDRDIDTTSSSTTFVLEEVRRLFLAIGVLLRIVDRGLSHGIYRASARTALIMF